MIGILTGDIINSEAYDAEKWIKLLSDSFQKFGPSPEKWEIYRGDEFQIKINQPSTVLWHAIYIKALVKTLNGLDVRIGIGIGKENYQSSRVTQSNGSAYVRSGHVFDNTKDQKINMLVKSHDKTFDASVNLMLQLGLTFMDNWSQVSAKMLKYVIENPGKSQKEMAEELKVSQSTISQRLNRTHYDLILKTNDYFKNELQKLDR